MVLVSCGVFGLVDVSVACLLIDQRLVPVHVPVQVAIADVLVTAHRPMRSKRATLVVGEVY